MKNYYSILGIEQDADQRAIKKAYIMLAKRYHPDKLTEEERENNIFADISEAYAVLSDETKREQYDETLKRYLEGEDVEREKREAKFRRYYDKAKRNLKLGKIEEALEFLDMVHDFFEYNNMLAPPDFNSYFGLALFKSGKEQEGLLLMDNAVGETMFNNEEILLNIAEAYFIKGDRVKAKDYLLKAAKLNPKNRRAIKMKMKYDPKKKSLIDKIFRRK